MTKLDIDYCRKYHLKEHQDRLLNILLIIEKTCSTYKIEYSLDGGTLLGAIRHKGFIPWDDDADVSMTRPNYEKFVKTITDNKTNLKIVYFLWIPRIRLEGLNGKFDFVDLFIYDDVPKSKFCSIFKKYKILFLQGMMHAKPVTNKKVSILSRWLLYVSWLCGRFFSNEKKIEIYQRTSRIGEKRPSGRLLIYNDTYKRIAIDYHTIESNYVSEHIYTLFENQKLRIYSSYDTVLKMHFQNYMSLPPEDKRKPEHFFNECCKYEVE